MNNPETRATLDIRHRTKTKNKTQDRRGNQDLTVQRHEQQWTQDTKQRQKRKQNTR